MGGRMGGYQSPTSKVDTVIRLFVEGKDDLDVLWSCWIKDDKRGARRLPEVEMVEQADGCERVVQRVKADLSEPDLISMGLVDRDTLLQQPAEHQCWAPADKRREVFLDADDARFGAQARGLFGATIAERMWVLPFWELENLVLLTPRLLYVHQHTRGPKKGGVLFSDEAQLLTALLALVEVLRPYFAGLVHTKVAQKKLSVSGIDQWKKSASELRAEVLAACAGSLDEPTLLELEQKLAEFDDAPSHDPVTRWRRVSRLADGKTLRNFICSSWISDGPDQMTRALARLMAEGDGPPAEVVQILKEMRARADELVDAPRAS